MTVAQDHPIARASRAAWLVADGDRTLVEQIVDWYQGRIDERVLRPGARLPSIRRFAADHGVSRFTVVEAYDRLVARGFVESRRGAGFYVRERREAERRPSPDAWAESARNDIDVVWLLRNMFKRMPAGDMPGGGVLPAPWLDETLIASSLRAIGRQSALSYLDYGHPQGFPPLREQLQRKLAELGIDTEPANLLTTNGVTQGLDLIAQRFVKPGDTVLVDEPSWFLLFGRYATLGVRLVGVPRLDDGPDLERLEALASEHRPRLYVTTAVLHNPTGSSMSAAKAFRVLRLAESLDFRIVEDDVYADLWQGAGTRLASLDQLDRVIYLGGFSKTLAASLRVGFVACEAGLARELTDLKMLVGLTSPEIGERIVHRVLSEGHYRRHLQRLRERLDAVRDPVRRELERLGLRIAGDPSAGMFLWADTGADANRIAREMLDHGYLMAPGSLFLPDQRPSTWMRFNVACSRNPAMIRRLGQVLGRQ
ncbi:MAG: PLP-dependent aminotransferase family protein [Burkholderiaceae bacterium]|nr:PLP-dependent aminotransferase family protein [Burkholderiaceae bacterium]